jgi:hypothetical protein
LTGAIVTEVWFARQNMQAGERTQRCRPNSEH